MGLVGESHYAPTYPLSMRDAHRKPYQSLRAPALTQHLVFRKGPFDHANDVRWISRIEAIILTVFEDLQEKGPQPRIGNFREAPLTSKVVSTPPGTCEPSIGLLRHRYVRRPRSESPSFLYEQHPIQGDGRYETVVIEAVWQSMIATLRFEVFEEHFTLTVTLELRAFGPRAGGYGIEEDKLKASPCAQHLARVCDWVTVRRKAAAVAEDSPLPTEVANALDHLTNKVWKDFAADVLNSAFTAGKRVLIHEAGKDAPPAETRSDKRKPPPDDIVGHFTGIVLGLNAINDDPEGLRPAGFDTGSERARPRHERYWQKKSAFADGGAERWAGLLFPLVHSASESAQGLKQNGSERSPFEAAEYMWNLFDGGTVLYGSAFGPQGPAGSPLQYLLLFDHDEHRAVGRTVHRLHTMGTMRLAAMFDLDRAIDRDRILSRLDAELAVYEATTGIEVLQARQLVDWETLVREIGLLDKLLEGSALLLEKRVGDLLAHEAEGVRQERSNADQDLPLKSAADVLTQQLSDAVNAAQSRFGNAIDGGAGALHARLHLCLVEMRAQASKTQQGLRKKQSATPVPRNHFRQEDLKLTDEEPLAPDEAPPVSKVVWGLRDAVGYLHRLAEELSSPSQLRQPLSTEDERQWTRIKAQASHVIRSYDRLDRGRTAKEYQQIILADVERAIVSMSNRLRMGVAIRAARTNYYLERLRDLIDASNLSPVQGYQAYGSFVDHRLDRAYSLLLQVNTKYQAVAERARFLRQARERDDAKARMQRIELMQSLAEVALFFVLGPYYAGGVALGMLQIGQDDKFAKALTYGTALALGTGLFLWHRWHARQKANALHSKAPEHAEQP